MRASLLKEAFDHSIIAQLHHLVQYVITPFISSQQLPPGHSCLTVYTLSSSVKYIAPSPSPSTVILHQTARYSHEHISTAAIIRMSRAGAPLGQLPSQSGGVKPILMIMLLVTVAQIEIAEYWQCHGPNILESIEQRFTYKQTKHQ